MSTQFPPSSPLREPDLRDKKYIKPEIDRGKIEYPTPHPSSTLGRSSSPVRGSRDSGQDVSPQEPPKKMSFELDKPTLPIMSHIKLIKVPLDKPLITIGRSSKSNDVVIKTNSKTISRNHIKINCMGEYLKIECLGQNGFGITIPRACYVYQLAPNEFKLVETSVPMTEFRITSNTIKLGSNHTEFVVYHKEKIIVKNYHNLIIEIKNNLLIINPREIDDNTEDETPVLKNTPIKPLDLHPITPNKRLFKITPEESTPIKKIKPTINEKQVLLDLTNTYKEKLSTPRSKSSGPKPQGLQVVDVSAISNLENIKTVLINHLAFSRLSSTPLSTLRSINNTIEQLSDEQLFSILELIPSIGTIDREGKDAAGKPLEREFYYLPENDDDVERPQLVGSIKGHGGLRSCRRTHKQYYWKIPLAKKNNLSQKSKRT